MLLALRPSLGWLGYSLLGKSPLRMLIVSLGMALISVVLLRSSKNSTTLNYVVPALGSTTVFIIPFPTQDFTVFDACAVESASKVIQRKTSPSARLTSTPIYVYQWSSHLGSKNIWLNFLAEIPGIRIPYLDIVKVLQKTPMEGMLAAGGWSGKPEWAIWLAAGTALLWRSGGVLMPTGVLPIKSFTIEPFGNRSGVIQAKGRVVQSSVLASPPHHPLLDSFMDYVINYDATLFWHTEGNTPLENLLSRSFKETCGTLEDASRNECKPFQLFNASSTADITFEKGSFGSTEYFLRLAEESYKLKHDVWMNRNLFKKHSLRKYCPLVYDELFKDVERI